MLSRKQTNRKHVYYKPTIPQENVVDMERWQVRGQAVNNGRMYKLWVFLCNCLKGLGSRKVRFVNERNECKCVGVFKVDTDSAGS